MLLVETEVTVRDTQPEEKRKPWSIRLPSDVLDYVKAAGSVPGRTATSVVVDAIELDRALEEVLAPHKARLKAFAEAEDLDLAHSYARVIGRLVELGLNASKPRK